MLGSLFALLSAISFSLNKVILRRAVLKVSDASIGILISVQGSGNEVVYIPQYRTGEYEDFLNAATGQSYITISDISSIDLPLHTPGRPCYGWPFRDSNKQPAGLFVHLPLYSGFLLSAKARSPS